MKPRKTQPMHSPDWPRYCKVCNLLELSSYLEFYAHHLSHVRQPRVVLTRIDESSLDIDRSDRQSVDSESSRESSNPIPPIKVSMVSQNGSKRFLVVQKKETPSSDSSESPKREPSPSDSDWSFKMEEEEEETVRRTSSRACVARRRTAATPRFMTRSRAASMSETEPKVPKFIFREPYVKLERIDAENLITCGISPMRRFESEVNLESSRSDLGRTVGPSNTPPTVTVEESANGTTNVTDGNGSSSVEMKKGQRTKNSKRGRKRRRYSQEVNGKESNTEPKESRVDSPPGVTEQRAATPDRDMEQSADTPTRDTEDTIESSPRSSRPPSRNLEESVRTPASNEEEIIGTTARNEEESIGTTARNEEESIGTTARNEEESVVTNARNEEHIFATPATTEQRVNQDSTVALPRIRVRSTSPGSDLFDHSANVNRSNMNATQLCPMPSTSTGTPLRLDFSACVHPPASTSPARNVTSGGDVAGISSTLINANQKNQDGNMQSLNASGVSEADRANENAYESITTDDNESRLGPIRPSEQASAFWASLRQALTNSQNANNQEPVIEHNNPAPNDMLTTNFLHSILAEHQIQHGSISSDNSEFVSLERLAVQHQQSRFDMTSEVTTPMEQLTQQVHRMTNPPPQITMISQHHIQAPPPLHAAGVPLSQQSSYNGVTIMQPSMGPPPLFQGFNFYPNQGFQQQGSSQQSLPRPPALQQCPQIQAGAYQNLAQPQPNRQKSRTSKRNVPAPPPPPEMEPKQRRSDPPKGNSPPPKGKGRGRGKGKAKAPPKPSTSGNRTPARKMTDPKVVASILAARGITVTPTTSRQTNEVQSTQQKSTQQNAQQKSTQQNAQQKSTQKKTTSSNPVLNISSAISITPSSRNKGNSGKRPANATATAPASVPTTPRAPAPTPSPSTTRAPAPTPSTSTTRAPAPTPARAAAPTPTPTPSRTPAPAPRRNSAPMSNNNSETNEGCIVVDLTDDEEPQVDQNTQEPSVNPLQQTMSDDKLVTEEGSEIPRGNQAAPEDEPLRCEPCNIEFLTEDEAERHRNDRHIPKPRRNRPDWMIPVVNLAIPGVRERLLELGVTSYIPLNSDFLQYQGAGEEGERGRFVIPVITRGTSRLSGGPFSGHGIKLGQMYSLLTDDEQ